jgi:hypothetical protein
MAISSVLGSSALLPAGLGFRNVLINGGFDVNQRAFSSATADATFGFDRWQLATSGGTTYSAQTFALGNTIPNQEPTNHARLVTTGQSGTGVYSILSQKIEDVRTSAGQQITVSFYAKAASGTPKVAIELTQNFGTGGSPSSEVNNYFGQIVLSTSWTKYVVTGLVPSIAGKTLGSASSYLRLLLWVSAGTDFNSRTGSIGIQSNTFDFWGVQLEQNSQPTPFEQRPIGTELALCQRYFERIQPLVAYQMLASGFVTATTNGAFCLFYETKRAAPTSITFTTASTFAINNSPDVATTVTSIAINASRLGTKSANVHAAVASGLTVGQGCHLNANSSAASTSIDISAEL